MINLLAFLIVCVVFVLMIHNNAFNKKKGTQQTKKTSSQNQNKSYNMQKSQKPRAGNKTSSVQAYRAQPQNDYYRKQQQMRDLKHRLEKKYSSAPRPMKENQKSTYRKNMNYRKPEKDTSILHQAKTNVAEYDADMMKEADRKWHENAHGKQLSPNWNGEDLLKEVYDLMVMGYSGNLNFERDFLSEGMDMINRIGMIDNNPEIINSRNGITEIRKQV